MSRVTLARLRARLLLLVFLALLPALALAVYLLGGAEESLQTLLLSLGLTVLLALAAAWLISDILILRQVSALLDAARRLAAGDLGARSGITYRSGELGQLARAFDELAEALARREAERQEAAQQLRLQTTALEAAAHGILITDREGTVVWVNPAFSALTGYAAEEIVGQNPRLLKSGRHDPAVYQRLWETISAGQVWQGEIINRRKDGSLYTEEQSITPVRAANGDITHFVAIKQDITQRQQAETALRQSEERSRALIEHSSDAIGLVAADGSLLYASPSTTAIVGYGPEEHLGQTTFHLIHPDDRERLMGLFADLVARPDHVVTAEYRIQHKDGRWLWIEGTATNLLHEPSVRAIVINYHDNTERKQAEEKLRARARYQEATAELGQHALAGSDLTWLMNEAVALIARALNVGHALILELNPEGSTLRLQAGVGFKEGVVGRATVATGLESQAGYTLLSKKPVVSTDLRTETRFTVSSLLRDHGLLCGMTVIIPGRERPIGVVGAYSLEPRAFNAEDEHFLQAIANVLANGIERKRAEEALQQANEKLKGWVDELEQNTREITQLSEMGELLQACRTTPEAYTVVAKAAQQLFPTEAGAMYMLNASQNTVEAVVVWGSSAAGVGEQVFAPDECWALRRGQAHLVRNPRSELLCQHLSTPLPSSYLCTPMMAQGETLGVLHLRTSPYRLGAGDTLGEPLTRGKQRLAVTVAEHIALAVANLRLRETLRSQAIRDPLTGLFNRRYMEESLAREVHRTARRNSPLGVIMLDIDHFKQFNDTFGHAAGDALLRELGLFLQSHVRVEDIACRYGGEEFTLILPEASLADTHQRAEQLRQDVKHVDVQHRGQALGAITLSLGVAVIPDHGATGEAVLQAADAALYRAKRQGRDQVVLAQLTPAPTLAPASDA